MAAGVILDSVGSLHGATELTGSHDVTTPIIDQITAQQIAGSAMFGTVENMQRGGQERRPAKSSLSQVKYRFHGGHLSLAQKKECLCTLPQVLNKDGMHSQ